MRFVCLSDTHNQHREITVPAGDVLLHAGDLTSRGKESSVLDFLGWYSSLPHRYKIFIAGNHDFFFECAEEARIRSVIPDNVIYLNDSGIEIEGIKIWGSPIQPWFYDWAFNRQRGAEIKKHWDLIPSDTDILITHGPPFGIGDKLVTGVPVGCEELLLAVERVQPKVHLFGHIHEAYGEQVINKTRFINASVLNENYVIQNEAVCVDL
jgi:Icc-related predicted phosphoesterase